MAVWPASSEYVGLNCQAVQGSHQNEPLIKSDTDWSSSHQSLRCVPCLKMIRNTLEFLLVIGNVDRIKVFFIFSPFFAPFFLSLLIISFKLTTQCNGSKGISKLSESVMCSQRLDGILVQLLKRNTVIFRELPDCTAVEKKNQPKGTKGTRR